jgi:hypothetical protein
LSALATVIEHFDVAVFLLTGAVGRTCTAAALVLGGGGPTAVEAIE